MSDPHFQASELYPCKKKKKKKKPPVIEQPAPSSHILFPPHPESSARRCDLNNGLLRHLCLLRKAMLCRCRDSASSGPSSCRFYGERRPWIDCLPESKQGPKVRMTKGCQTNKPTNILMVNVFHWKKQRKLQGLLPILACCCWPGCYHIITQNISLRSGEGF